MKYSLIAFDMDGTLLNSRKQVSGRTAEAVRRASEAGKQCVYCTGRATPELSEYREILPGMRYAVCNNGALLWDMKEWKPVYEHLLPAPLILEILKAAEAEEHLIQVYTDKEILFDDYSEEKVIRGGMGEYLPMYRRIVKQITGFRENCKAGEIRVGKLSVHLTGEEARERLKAKMDRLQLPLEIRRSNKYTLEFTDAGVTKAYGLKKLCEMLNIPREETIAAGDGGNDIDVLEWAGLGIAVANATNEVKQIAAVIVSDNDHDGCAEAVEKYLL